MGIGILGSGLMGGKLGTLFARSGHDVVFSSARREETLLRIEPILSRNTALEAFDDFSDFLESISRETSKICQVRGSNPCRGGTGNRRFNSELCGQPQFNTRTRGRTVMSFRVDDGEVAPMRVVWGVVPSDNGCLGGRSVGIGHRL